MAKSRPMKIDREKVKDRYNTYSVEVDGKKRRVTDCGDEVAEMLRNVVGDEALAKVAAEHGLQERWDSWSHLAPGQRRMNLGNTLRHKLRREREAATKAAA